MRADNDQDSRDGAHGAHHAGRPGHPVASPPPRSSTRTETVQAEGNGQPAKWTAINSREADGDVRADSTVEGYRYVEVPPLLPRQVWRPRHAASPTILSTPRDRGTHGNWPPLVTSPDPMPAAERNAQTRWRTPPHTTKTNKKLLLRSDTRCTRRGAGPRNATTHCGMDNSPRRLLRAHDARTRRLTGFRGEYWMVVQTQPEAGNVDPRGELVL